MRLLLETHVPRAVTTQLQRHGIDAVALQDWQAGAYREADDEEILMAAAADRRVVVTFDRKTFPSRLKIWAETGLHHAGVLLISQKTFSPTDIGGLVRALLHLVEASGDQDWTDRVVYMSAPVE